MTKEEYKEYLKTEHWQEVRKARLSVDKYRCYLCGTPRRLNVHHLRYDNLGDENVHKDLISLCLHCHLMLHRVQNATQAEYRRAVRSGSKRDMDTLRSKLKDALVAEIWLRDRDFGGELDIFNGKDLPRMLRILKILYPDIGEIKIQEGIKKRFKEASKVLYKQSEDNTIQPKPQKRRKKPCKKRKPKK